MSTSSAVPRQSVRDVLVRVYTRGAADRSLADAAYGKLKRQIIRCELQPGTLVTEAMLVRRLRLGKTPVREALARLVHERLVRSIPRHGYEIAPITLSDAQALFGLRLVLEPAAAQLAAGHVDAARLRRLDVLCKAGYDVDDESSIEDFLRANYELHATIATATGNPRLAQDIERILDESERLFRLGLMLRNRTSEMAHEHRELVTALAAGDGDTARSVAGRQIVESQRMVMDALIASPTVLSAPVGIAIDTVRQRSRRSVRRGA
jgi:DNA-binding GntR family transcriptional regulator